MASKGVYRSPNRGSIHTWHFYRVRRHDPRWSKDYQQIKETVKQEYLDGALFMIFFIAALELLIILSIVIYRIFNGETALTPGCYLDRILHYIIGIFVRH